MQRRLQRLQNAPAVLILQRQSMPSWKSARRNLTNSM